MVASTVKSSVDPTFPGQEDIIPAEKGATEGSNIRTSKTGDRPKARRLATAVERSERQLDVHRNQRRLFVRQYAGSNYGDYMGGDFRDPLNLLYSLVSTLVPALTVDPRATVGTVKGNLAFAETFRLAIDDESDRITLAKTIKSVIIDSLFGLGVIKTGLKAAPGFDDEGRLEVDAGTLFSERVSFTNYIIDMAGCIRSGAQYEGDRYELTEDYARSTGMFDERTLSLLISARGPSIGTYGISYNQTCNDYGRTRDDEYIERLQLVDLFLPDEQKVVTLPGDVALSEHGFLNQFDWDGDPSGPYDTIGFSPVPDKMLATPVIGAIYDMYVLLNKVARKIGRQADRQKDIIVYQKGREGDGDAVRDSNDGDMVGVDDVDGVKALSFGGTHEDGYKTVAWLQDFINRIAGNPDLIGGLSADAKTLGQDQLSLQNANARIDDWRKTALETCGSVLRKIGGYIWTDKDTRRSLELRSGEFTFPREFGREREGAFEDYRIGIDAHHRPPMSPDQSYLRKQRWIKEILIPLAEPAAAQGKTLDVEKVAMLTARDLGIDDADQMFVPVQEVQNTQQDRQQPTNPEQGPRLSQPKPSLEGV